MAVQQPVAPERIRDIVEISALRNSPLALTCRVNETWQNFRSRFLGLRDGQVWIEFPQPERNKPQPDLPPGAKVGVAFKQRHHKYLFSTAVRETGEWSATAGEAIRAICIAAPARMFQMQRRMFERVDVPHDRQVFVDFWEGGLAHEPIDDLRDKLMYHGQLVDLSIGGFQVRLLGDDDPRFTDGGPIGAAMLCDGDDKRVIRVDAQFRHAHPDEFGTTLGMQIVGLNETARGRKAMEAIAELNRSFLGSDRRKTKDPSRVRVGC